LILFIASCFLCLDKITSPHRHVFRIVVGLSQQLGDNNRTVIDLEIRGYKKSPQLRAFPIRISKEV